MASLVDTRPATTAGAVTAIPMAVGAILIGLNVWNPTDAEYATVTAAAAVIVGILAKFVASVVYCRSTVKDLLPDVDQPVHVDPSPPPATPPAQSPQPDPNTPLGGTPASLAEYMSRQPPPPPPPPQPMRFPPPPPPT